MAKGQKRSNREVKKPKKNKDSVIAPVVTIKGVQAGTATPKKKS